PTAVGTVGRVEVEPNSPNVVPGRVRMTVDLRHHEDAILEDMQKRLHAAIEEIALEDRVDIALKTLHAVAATKVHPDYIAAGRAGGREGWVFRHGNNFGGAGLEAGVP